MEWITILNDEHSSLLENITYNEIYNSKISNNFKELAIESITNDYEDLYSPYDGL